MLCRFGLSSEISESCTEGLSRRRRHSLDAWEARDNGGAVSRPRGSNAPCTTLAATRRPSERILREEFSSNYSRIRVECLTTITIKFKSREEKCAVRPSRPSSSSTWELPLITSAKCFGFLTPSPLVRILYYGIHAPILTLHAFPRSPPPSNADIIPGSPLAAFTRVMCRVITTLIQMRPPPPPPP